MTLGFINIENPNFLYLITLGSYTACYYQKGATMDDSRLQNKILVLFYSKYNLICPYHSYYVLQEKNN